MSSVWSPCTLTVGYFRKQWSKRDVTAPSLAGSVHSKMLYEAGKRIMLLHIRGFTPLSMEIKYDFNFVEQNRDELSYP